MRNARLDNVVAFVGRKNSGKTTLVEQIIAALCLRGLEVSSVKHHGHSGFEIDVPGKDSYRHHEAGTRATAIAAPDRIALVEELEVQGEGNGDAQEIQYEQCLQAIGLLPASNIVIVEGFKQVGLPTVELFRADNPRDREAVPVFLARLRSSLPTTEDTNSQNPNALRALPVAVVSDIDEVIEAATQSNIPCFSFSATDEITNWLIKSYAKPLYSIAIQAGGESKRMGISKALVPFHDRPLIEHMVDRLAPIAAELIITTNEAERLAYLQVRYPGLRLVPDKLQTRGALPGFITALDAARYPLVATVACDMVNISPELIDFEASLFPTNWQINEKRESEISSFNAVVPFNGLGFEPFCATYQKEPCLKAALACWKEGKDRMQDMIERITILPITKDSCALYDEISFANANTPTELHALEAESIW